MMAAQAYDALVDSVRARLSEKSAAHSERVADAAYRLAEVYGEDRDEARLAGLLHDWCRDIPKGEMVRRALEGGLTVSDVDRAAPYLLHAPLGAVEVAERFPELPSRVIDAIATHTFGSADMDPLGMIVYIADSIEPYRSHDGVDELRAAIGEVPLAELFVRTYALSLKHLIEARRPIHDTTIHAWNAVIGGKRS